MPSDEGSAGEITGIGLRRAPDLDANAPLPESDPRLAARIESEIRASGAMTFARFMEIALYDPEAGYYAMAEGGPGRSADFLTAPEGHLIFGWAIARQLEEVWARLDRPDPFVVREHGAGTGALAIGILDGLRRSSSPVFDAVRYHAVEVSERRSRAFGDRLAEAGFAATVEPSDDHAASGAVIANELLDALPVHRVRGGPDGQLEELFVAVGGDEAQRFREVPGDPSTPALADRLAAEGIALVPGQRAEICLAIDGWLAEAVQPLERGLLLVLDYGHQAEQLYDPSRGSLLRAYHRHRVHDDPFVAIGRQDLTAHVDLTAVERAAARARLERLGRTTQAAFLANLGLGDLLVGLQAEPGTTLETYLEARSAVVRMLDPRATGAFAVLMFGRGLSADPPLRGFGGLRSP